MHEVTVNITSITWDEEEDFPPEVKVMLPATYDMLTVTVDDGSDDEQILGAVLDALTDEFDYLVKDVQFTITRMTRVAD